MKIRTVLKDIEPTDLGYCQVHEHIWVDPTPASQRHPALRIDRYDASLAELIAYRTAGGQAMVDAQPVGAGRNITRLGQLSTESQVHIIAATGFHRPMFYSEGHWIFSASVDVLTDLFSSEIKMGAFQDGGDAWPRDRTAYRAGLVKAAIGSGPIDEWTQRLLTAAGQAAVRTGCPLMLHTESGDNAVEAIRLLKTFGLQPDRVIVCHVDRQADNLAPHLNVAKTGANLDYDTITRLKYHDNDSEIVLIRQMLAAGHLRQLMLALDTTAERLSHYGGSIGLDHILTRFREELYQSGISQGEFEEMMLQNPARVLARQIDQ